MITTWATSQSWKKRKDNEEKEGNLYKIIIYSLKNLCRKPHAIQEQTENNFHHTHNSSVAYLFRSEWISHTHHWVHPQLGDDGFHPF
jgi:hypothetical protein